MLSPQKILPLNYFLRLTFGVRHAAEDIDTSQIREPQPGEPMSVPNLIWVIERMLDLGTRLDMSEAVPAMRWLSSFEQDCQKATRLMHEFFNKAIVDRRKAVERGEARDAPVLDVLEQHMAAGAITAEQRDELLLIFFLAGSDSLARTFSFFILQLADRPELQVKIQTELDAAVGPDRLVDEADMKNIPLFM